MASVSEPSSARSAETAAASAQPAAPSAETAAIPVPTSGSGHLTRAEALSFVNNEWSRVWATKASLEQRAITLITVSGVLVTLAFGFTTAITKGKGYANFDTVERAFLVVSLALFAVSALIALLVNVPKGYSVPDFRDVLGVSAVQVEGTPLTRLDGAIERATELNDTKALRLTYAFCAQLAAIATLAVVVGIVTS